jgi:catechol 2,3-dioxygenase-like lactoylglutathione lyase family enzyme
MDAEMPRLAGVHHLKLPVRDLARSEAWYARVLGYHRAAEFVEKGALTGISLDHPAGGPHFGLRLDPARAEAAAGFDYFAIGVPDEEAIEALAARLDTLGEKHGGVIRTKVGWILPLLHDPDGHEVRFYTMPEHSPQPPGQVMRVEDGRNLIDAAERRTPMPHR